MVIIETQRLLLRTWQPEDAQPFLEINQDPQVTQYLDLFVPKDIEESMAFMDRNNQQQALHRHAFWAAQLRETGALIGFVGLDRARAQLPCAPAVKVGWRLASAYWGKGYATEAALACLDYGFNRLLLKEIIAIVVPQNVRSIRVIERLDFQHEQDRDFLHPLLHPDHPLAWHLLYSQKNQLTDV